MNRDLLSVIFNHLVPTLSSPNVMQAMKDVANFSAMTRNTGEISNNFNWRKQVLSLQKEASLKWKKPNVMFVEEKDNPSNIENEEYANMLKRISWENYYYFLLIFLQNTTEEDDNDFFSTEGTGGTGGTGVNNYSFAAFFHNEFDLDEMRFISLMYPKIWNDKDLFEYDNVFDNMDEDIALGLFAKIVDDKSGKTFDFVFEEGHGKYDQMFDDKVIIFIIEKGYFDLMNKVYKRFPQELRNSFIETMRDIYEPMMYSGKITEWLEWMKNKLKMLPLDKIYSLYRSFPDETVLDMFKWLKANGILPGSDFLYQSINMNPDVVEKALPWIYDNFTLPQDIRKKWYLYIDYHPGNEKFIEKMIYLGILARPDNNILYNINYYSNSDDSFLEYLRKKYNLSYIPSKKRGNRFIFNSKEKEVASVVWLPNGT